MFILGVKDSVTLRNFKNKYVFHTHPLNGSFQRNKVFSEKDLRYFYTKNKNKATFVFAHDSVNSGNDTEVEQFVLYVVYLANTNLIINENFESNALSEWNDMKKSMEDIDKLMTETEINKFFDDVYDEYWYICKKNGY